MGQSFAEEGTSTVNMILDKVLNYADTAYGLLEDAHFVTSIDRTTGFERPKTRGLHSQTIYGYSVLAPLPSDPFKSLPRLDYDSFGFNIGSYYDLNEKNRLEALVGFNAPLGFGVKLSAYHYLSESFGLFAGAKISYLPDNLLDIGDGKDFKATTTSIQVGYSLGAGKNWLLKLGYDFSYSFKESANRETRSALDGVFIETLVAFGK
ncbi:MAG: hypothetical protein E7K04_05545 [Helicobacter sp.]|nr:hypothetical protein [Helicobacter sp.]